MKKSLTLLFTTIFLFLFITTCDRSDNPPPEDIQEFGYLSLQVGLKIEASSVGRTEAVDPSDFLVTIHDASDGSEVMRWDTYAEVPAEVQLPTGSYFVRATNLEFPADAAFEQPWYFGESDVFTIDKEEIKTINLTCTLANCKISFVYSQNVLDNFTNWNATATINDGSGIGDSLEWFQSDPSEGYFITDFPIDIAVHLEYEKAFSNELITRNFNTTISTPLPATHYRINIDAALEDGRIVINITVDDSFQTEEINLGDEDQSPNASWVPGDPWIDVRDEYAYETVQIGEQTWMTENLRATQLNDGSPIPHVANNQNWAALTSPGYSWYNNDEETNSIYGPLYNWYVVEAGDLCPTDWHVPTEGDWDTLISHLGGTNIAGGKLKEVGTIHWNSPNTGASNESNFTGLPGGSHGNTGDFFDINAWGNWWTSQQSSSTLGISRHIGYSGVEIYEGSYPKGVGFSIRCLKD